MSRRKNIDHFYQIMEDLEEIVGGKRLLSQCDGAMDWPKRGVYFFFEEGEVREHVGLRVVRVGTHALKIGSKRTLWCRLSQHKGTMSGKYAGGGNHRGSVFRLHVGTAMISKNGYDAATWAKGSTAKEEVRHKEQFIEKLVSTHIRSMPFLWVEVYDPPGPDSSRNYIEKNTIALLSNFRKSECIDLASPNWLGNYVWNEKIRLSGLWNVNNVDKKYDPNYLHVLQKFVQKM